MSFNSIAPVASVDAEAPALHVLQNGGRISPPCYDRNEALRIAATAIMLEQFPRLVKAAKGISKRKVEGAAVHALIEALEGSDYRTDGRNVFLTWKALGQAVRVWNGTTGREKPIAFQSIDIDGWRVA
jgi:hypothetical protein